MGNKPFSGFATSNNRTSDEPALFEGVKGTRRCLFFDYQNFYCNGKNSRCL
jgi:hypothetical protein